MRYAAAMVPDDESRAKSSPKKTKRKRYGGLIGLGLDGADGHKRITKGDDFLLVGGSQETHDRMTGMVLRMRERLLRKGKSFSQMTPTEFEDLGKDCLR
jgi:hypothetical protein